MTVGDKAAAAKLQVWSAADLVSKTYQWLNQRGDDIADVMTRVSKTESDAKALPTKGVATVQGANFASGTLGITSNLTVPAASYPRIIAVSVGYMCSQQTTGNAEFGLYKDGTAVRLTRSVDPNDSGAYVYWDYLAANTTTTYQQRVTVSGQTSVPADSRYVWLEYLALTIS